MRVTRHLAARDVCVGRLLLIKLESPCWKQHQSWHDCTFTFEVPRYTQIKNLAEDGRTDCTRGADV